MGSEKDRVRKTLVTVYAKIRQKQTLPKSGKRR